jgi:hypothetical protein
MAEKRCPMCSKPNPEEASECAYCGARLKPLVVGPSESEAQLKGQPPEGAGSGEEDWISRIRAESEVSAGEAAEEAPSEEGELDWLSRLRRAEGESEGPPESPVPGWLEQEAGDFAPAAGAEDQPQVPQPPEPAPSPEGELAAGEVPDWLARIRTRQAQGAELPVEADDQEWLDRLRRENRGGTGSLTPLPDEEPAAAPAPKPSGAKPPSKAEPVAPQPPAQAQPPAEPPAISPPPVSKPPTKPPFAVPAERIAPPEWLEIGPPPVPEAPADKPAAPAAPSPEKLGDLTWLQSYDEQPPAKEEEEESLPHIPALISEEMPAALGPADIDMDALAVELPDWLSDLNAAKAESPEQAEKPNLAPATLPSWLEAMRPIETFHTTIEVEPEEEQAVESAGPLAGLRGVLLAEPIVAMPRTPSVGPAHLDITDRQFAQAELLHRMVEEEERELPPIHPGRRRLPLLRWAVSLVMIAAVTLPVLVGPGSFPFPTQVSRDLEPLVSLVNGLPAGRPMLMVFDYEPGYSGEMEAVDGALIDQLMARGIPIVTLSTRPSGPPLAERLLSSIGARHGYEPGSGYLHLGYLSGGTTAVQLFAAAPRDVVLEGFAPPTEQNGAPVCAAWNCPMLAGISHLSDFSMVAVVTSGTDNARVWAEQAHPYMGQTPLVMVLSAGAEPLIRPYYEALQPQVSGILSGLPSAVAYEQANGQQGEAQARWDGYGSGMFAVEGVLAVGALYGAFLWLLRPDRRTPEEEEAHA